MQPSLLLGSVGVLFAISQMISMKFSSEKYHFAIIQSPLMLLIAAICLLVIVWRSFVSQASQFCTSSLTSCGEYSWKIKEVDRVRKEVDIQNHRTWFDYSLVPCICNSSSWILLIMVYQTTYNVTPMVVWEITFCGLPFCWQSSIIFSKHCKQTSCSHSPLDGKPFSAIPSHSSNPEQRAI